MRRSTRRFFHKAKRPAAFWFLTARANAAQTHTHAISSYNYLRWIFNNTPLGLAPFQPVANIQKRKFSSPKEPAWIKMKNYCPEIKQVFANGYSISYLASTSNHYKTLRALFTIQKKNMVSFSVHSKCSYSPPQILTRIKLNKKGYSY